VRDARVSLLRVRLAAPSASGEDELFDAELAAAVIAFQASQGLADDGVAGPHTLAALNGPDREADIAAAAANMERWRWMPRDLGDFHVLVNVPEFVVRVFSDGEEVHQTRVVVGKPANPTPTFSHAIDHLVVNPYWNVPTSIVTKEMIPEIRGSGGNYFSRQGYQVFAQVGGRSYQVDPGRIDWNRVNPRAVRIRQVPGDRNALGRIKFMFPNQHSVYLHDTPSKRLFQRDERALSHGCVRVDEPLAFADALLPYAAPEWNSVRLKKLYGGKERRINLDRPVPVHLAYFSMRIEADGTIRRFRDIYGYDQRMLKAPDA
jgi:murein L,D-transpeptidase YcbB/YkuD